MFRHRLEHTADPTVALQWFLLSFSGGAINAGGFLATGRFVSHVTGFATLFGVEASNHQLSTALGFLSVPVFFLLGAFAAGLLIDRPIHLGRKPHFDWVMGLSALCLLLTAAGGEILHSGGFGEALLLKENYFMLVLLCLASGLQNAAITSSSGRSVRTTHLTGLTTDLGLGLAKIASLGRSAPSLPHELRANYLRAGSIAAFVAGSAIGAWFFVKFGYQGFLLPALISLYASWEGRNAKRAPHETAPD